MNTPKATVWDIGKVLLDFDFGRAARALSPMSDLGPEAYRTLIDQSPLLHRFETGLITSDQFHEELKRHSGFRGELSDFAPRFSRIFTEIADMIALHAEFRRRGIPTYIFSNTNALAVEEMRASHPFIHQFDGYIFSFEVGAMKPSLPIYLEVEKRTGLQGSDLFYLDDRPENIAAGLERGWHAHLHADPKETWRVVQRVFGWDNSGPASALAAA